MSDVLNGAETQSQNLQSSRYFEGFRLTAEGKAIAPKESIFAFRDALRFAENTEDKVSLQSELWNETISMALNAKTIEERSAILAYGLSLSEIADIYENYLDDKEFLEVFNAAAQAGYNASYAWKQLGIINSDLSIVEGDKSKEKGNAVNFPKVCNSEAFKKVIEILNTKDRSSGNLFESILEGANVRALYGTLFVEVARNLGLSPRSFENLTLETLANLLSNSKSLEGSDYLNEDGCDLNGQLNALRQNGHELTVGAAYNRQLVSYIKIISAIAHITWAASTVERSLAENKPSRLQNANFNPLNLLERLTAGDRSDGSIEATAEVLKDLVIVIGGWNLDKRK